MQEHLTKWLISWPYWNAKHGHYSWDHHHVHGTKVFARFVWLRDRPVWGGGGGGGGAPLKRSLTLLWFLDYKARTDTRKLLAKGDDACFNCVGHAGVIIWTRKFLFPLWWKREKGKVCFLSEPVYLFIAWPVFAVQICQRLQNFIWMRFSTVTHPPYLPYTSPS